MRASSTLTRAITMPKPTYPSALTVKSWDKAKGVLARITKVETGVTALLKAAETAFNNAPFKDMEDSSALNMAKRGGIDTLKAYQKEWLATYHPPFKALETHFRNLSTELGKKATAFESQPKLAQFAKVISLMASEANKFSYAVAWGTVSETMQKEITASINSLDEARGNEAENLENALEECKKCVKKLQGFKTTPTPKEYVKLFSGTHRMPGTYLSTAGKANPQIQKIFAPFMKYASDNFTKEPPANTNMEKQVQADIEAFQDAMVLIRRQLGA